MLGSPPTPIAPSFQSLWTRFIQGKNFTSQPSWRFWEPLIPFLWMCLWIYIHKFLEGFVDYLFLGTYNLLFWCLSIGMQVLWKSCKMPCLFFLVVCRCLEYSGSHQCSVLRGWQIRTLGGVPKRWTVVCILCSPQKGDDILVVLAPIWCTSSSLKQHQAAKFSFVFSSVQVCRVCWVLSAHQNQNQKKSVPLAASRKSGILDTCLNSFHPQEWCVGTVKSTCVSLIHHLCS